ncbi:MAG: CAP domain-containing protein [Saprospiraceae bacterium]|nr:CAP domain-containing protein [Saprospiraceae bacterium]
MIIAKAAATAALILTSFLPPSNLTYSNLSESEKQTMLNDVNRLRAKGCHCGRKYMPPVKPLIWNTRLEKAALAHANDMERNEFFDHQGQHWQQHRKRASKAA